MCREVVCVVVSVLLCQWIETSVCRCPPEKPPQPLVTLVFTSASTVERGKMQMRKEDSYTGQLKQTLALLQIYPCSWSAAQGHPVLLVCGLVFIRLYFSLLSTLLPGFMKRTLDERQEEHLRLELAFIERIVSVFATVSTMAVLTIVPFPSHCSVYTLLIYELHSPRNIVQWRADVSCPCYKDFC